MAEIRKHKEKVTGFAAQIREAIGNDIRPVQPGSKPQDDQLDQPQPETSSATTWFLASGATNFLSLADESDIAEDNDSADL